MSVLKIGVVGYTDPKFDAQVALSLLEQAFDQVAEDYHTHATPTEIMVVSGLTNLGIPALAYRLAKEYGWKTSGVACAKALNFECFPVDHYKIVGENWGDESEAFLRECDVIIRVGGSKQSLAEVATFKQRGGKVYEYDLPALPN